MSEVNRTTLKAFFETADTPTQGQFIDLIDSLVNIIEDAPKSETVTLNASTPTSVVFTNPFPAAATYKIIIIDEDAVGYEKPTSLTINGFDIQGLSPGDVDYIAIKTN